MEKSKALTYTRLYYLLYFGAVSCIFPYLNLYYRRIGLSGLQIGVLSALPALVVPLASPLWGIRADSLSLHGTLLSVAVAGTIVPVLPLPAGSTMSWLVSVTLIYAFFYGPTGRLIDSGALDVADVARRSYGELRAWGTIGFIVSARALGRIMERTGLRSLFHGYVLPMVATLVDSRFLPPMRKPWATPKLRRLGGLLTDRVFVLFLVSIFIALRSSHGGKQLPHTLHGCLWRERRNGGPTVGHRRPGRGSRDFPIWSPLRKTLCQRSTYRGLLGVRAAVAPVVSDQVS